MTILSFRFMGIRAPESLNGEVDRLVADPASGGSLLWTRTDVRDAAIACRQAVETDDVASGPYNITGARVLIDVPSEEIIRDYCGDTEIRVELKGYESPLSCERAHKEFGYKPRYIWSVSDRHLEAK
jgi:nucleoside-diphosphate-sugar epimerase